MSFMWFDNKIVTKPSGSEDKKEGQRMQMVVENNRPYLVDGDPPLIGCNCASNSKDNKICIHYPLASQELDAEEEKKEAIEQRKAGVTPMRIVIRENKEWTNLMKERGWDKEGLLIGKRQNGLREPLVAEENDKIVGDNDVPFDEAQHLYQYKKWDSETEEQELDAEAEADSTTSGINYGSFCAQTQF
uniref:Pre-mRNA-splicing factor SLU7 n=1 Tax=Globodera pallida TaxID=36090 RepID=A0A183BSL6_GLOPA